MCYGRLESLRKHQAQMMMMLRMMSVSACLLACVQQFHNKRKERQGKKRTTNKKKPNNKTRLKACLIVCLVCLLFGFSENNPKTFPARNQRRKGCFH